MHDLYDVTIIGGGAAGLYSSFYSGLRGMKTKIIEYQSSLGGKVQLFPEKKIWDIGGQPPITGDAFIKQLIAQALTFNPTVELNTKVVQLEERADGIFDIHTNTGSHYSKTVIFAVGGGIINPQKLSVDGVPKADLKNLHYVVRSFEQFRDQHVVVSGGGNTAIDWANELKGIAKEIHVVYRGEELSAHESQVTFLKDHAHVQLNTTIHRVIANDETRAIEKIVLQNTIDQSETEVAVDHLIVSHGFDMDQSIDFKLSKELGRVNDFYVETTAQTVTAIPGLFAAGDIASYSGKVNLLVGCFQDAVNAVNMAKLHIEPQANKTAMVSSHNERVQKTYAL
ncbi:NAD(P)/FAD-dependent oxidoreductase [Kurthia sibirica]|uniref:NAD(P)/FAD-dependent oxidoreductase n=1 Tax=Kurthia sibirica TaxID=202750 RepID=UPI00116B98C0|nr:NAD(P)/FAD-dependent oxidoreductase [Kurthia sibirica]GEK34404.1 ferredoxin--NADP reductase 1 [Kurthia sibirica]